MADFKKEKLHDFLGIVRKYMQVRGNLSQKDLAEKTKTGDSTMSRFLNQKTSEINPQLIVKIVAILAIPLHEIIDFVEEEYTEEFKKLINVYREKAAEEPAPDQRGGPEIGEGDVPKINAQIKLGQKTHSIPFGGENTTLHEKIDKLSAKQRLYLNDFFELDHEGKDLIVDVGNNIIRYIRQKGLE